MSAPNQGRQSPEPEGQSGAQQQDPQAKPDQGVERDSGKNELEGLASNPEHPLAKASEEKTSKKK
jgi:hypothetical protein